MLWCDLHLQDTGKRGNTLQELLSAHYFCSQIIFSPFAFILHLFIQGFIAKGKLTLPCAGCFLSWVLSSPALPFREDQICRTASRDSLWSRILDWAYK